jgi:hypothetical protein
MKLNSEKKDIIWEKLGNSQNFNEIQLIYFEKLFTIFGYNPCKISNMMKTLEFNYIKNYEVSCFSVKNFFIKFFYYIIK